MCFQSIRAKTVENPNPYRGREKKITSAKNKQKKRQWQYQQRISNRKKRCKTLRERDKRIDTDSKQENKNEKNRIALTSHISRI